MGQLLGYVFWHRPRSRAPPGGYERKLAAFQETLRSHGPDGFVDALSFRLESRPWSRHRSKGYEDWYLVKNFGALGVLNDAAVANPSKRPHDDIARDATGSAGGVYKLLKGGLPLREARFATWVSKPTRTAYQAFYDDMTRLVANRRTDLWRRQMVLGRSPEFCVHSESRLDLPIALRPRTLGVELVAAGRSTTGAKA